MTTTMPGPPRAHVRLSNQWRVRRGTERRTATRSRIDLLPGPPRRPTGEPFSSPARAPRSIHTTLCVGWIVGGAAVAGDDGPGAVAGSDVCSVTVRASDAGLAQHQQGVEVAVSRALSD